MKQWVVFHREKTKIKCSVPLLPKAIDIVKKYLVQADGELFPVYSNQKTNDYLKDIARLAEINKNISYHSARHTFATTVTLSNSVPIETVSKLLGHTNLKTTQIYSRVLETKLATDMDDLRKRLEEIN